MEVDSRAAAWAALRTLRYALKSEKDAFDPVKFLERQLDAYDKKTDVQRHNAAREVRVADETLTEAAVF